MNLLLAYLQQIWMGVDQLVNALIPPFTGVVSSAGETLSARAFRAWRDGRPWGRVMLPFINTIFFWQDNHCRGAHARLMERTYLPDEYRAAPPAPSTTTTP
jgi:hypothetical protein